MEDSMIRVVNAGGMLIMGSLEGCDLVSPRVLNLENAGNGQLMIRLLQIVGAPKRITLGPTAFVYQPEDDGLIATYRESVTGLTIAKTLPGGNVVPIGGKR